MLKIGYLWIVVQFLFDFVDNRTKRVIALIGWHCDNMDVCMACDLTSFSAVFESYQNYGKVIMNVRVQWNHVYIAIPSSM